MKINKYILIGAIIGGLYSLIGLVPSLNLQWFLKIFGDRLIFYPGELTFITSGMIVLFLFENLYNFRFFIVLLSSIINIIIWVGLGAFIGNIVYLIRNKSKEKKQKGKKNIGGFIGGIVGFTLEIFLITLLNINNHFLYIFNPYNVVWILIYSVFLIFIGYLIGSLIQIKRYILLGILFGGIIGFLSPIIIQLQWLNFICPSVPGLPQEHSLCVADFYLKFFGTKLGGGDMEGYLLLFYLPLFVMVWTILGWIIGRVIESIKMKRYNKWFFIFAFLFLLILLLRILFISLSYINLNLVNILESFSGELK